MVLIFAPRAAYAFGECPGVGTRSVDTFSVSNARDTITPPEGARTLFRTLAPVLDGERPLSRLSKEAGTREQYAIQIDVLAFEEIRDRYGSYAAAAERMAFDVLRPPPRFARLTGGRF